MVTTKNLDKTKVLNMIYDFFKHFKTWFGPSPVTPNENELEKYFSKNFQMFLNGQLLVKSTADYASRLQEFQKKYSNFQISEPLEEPLVCDNQVALYFRIDLMTHDRKQKQLYTMTLFIIENDKISRWVGVNHEKGAEDSNF